MLLQYRGSPAKRNFLLIVLVVCLNFIYTKGQCSQGALRLVNGGSYHEGRLEICYGNSWGTVCDDGWSNANAQVVCRQLGYPTTGAYYRDAAYFGQGTGSIVLDDVSCYGNETSLYQQCSHRPPLSHNCGHNEDVGVVCPALFDGAVRLVGGSNSLEGRVEVYRSGSWGTVCDDLWDNTDATVVCRQLGLGSSGTAYSSAHFGEGTGSIVMDDVHCTGSESTLTSCYHTTNHNCDHSEDAGVRCSNFCIDGAVRLVGGSSSLEGRVEVCRNESWGTVCDDSWGTNDATVVCRQLGYNVTGTPYSRAYFGSGTGSILMDDVACTGSESYLTNCSHTTNHNCVHSEDAGVSCAGSGASAGAIIGGIVGGIVFLIFVTAVIVICVVALNSKSNRSRARARQAAPAFQMTSIPAQTTSTATGAYTQSQPNTQNQPPPPSYSEYMKQQTQPTAPMAYPGYAAPAGYPTQGYGYPVQGYPTQGYGYPAQGYPAPPPPQQGFVVQGYPQQDYSQTGYPQQVPYPQQQQQEAPVGYPQQEPQGYGGTNPATDES